MHTHFFFYYNTTKCAYDFFMFPTQRKNKETLKNYISAIKMLIVLQYIYNFVAISIKSLKASCVLKKKFHLFSEQVII